MNLLSKESYNRIFRAYVTIDKYKSAVYKVNGHFTEGVAHIMKNPKACFYDTHDLIVVG